MAQSDPHVIIIGAGITGLLVAQGLKSAGISYSIFDSESFQGARTREWSLALRYASRDLEALLPKDLYSRIREAYTDPSMSEEELGYTQWYDSATGKMIHRMPYTETIFVSRKRMKKLCSQGVEVRYNMKMETAIFEDGKVKAKFANGEVAEGDLLIGCDGSKSAVREVLLGAEKAKRTPCGLRLTTSIVKYADPEVARKVRKHPRMYLGHHSDGIFNLISTCNVPDSNDPTTWEFYLVMSVLGQSPEGHDDATLLADLKSYGEKLADPFRTAVMQISKTTPLFNDRLYYWIPIPWDNHDGRITLAGDAAHPMPPYRGQGCGQSIRDAANLVASIKAQNKIDLKSALPKIISEYEEEAIKRGKEEVEMSVQAMILAHDWEKLMASPIIKLAGRKISEAQLE